MKALVLAQRAAFVDGVVTERLRPCHDSDRAAEQRFPIPTITGPRVVKLAGLQYRVVRDRVEVFTVGHWHESVNTWSVLVTLHPADRAELFHLLNNPTETVEATMTPTGKQRILAQRTAYVEGVYAERQRPFHDADAQAVRRFPMPTVTRPRVVTLLGREYRMVNGVIETQDIDGQWRPSVNTWARDLGSLTEADQKTLFALLKDPTETVEVE